MLRKSTLILFSVMSVTTLSSFSPYYPQPGYNPPPQPQYNNYYSNSYAPQYPTVTPYQTGYGSTFIAPPQPNYAFTSPQPQQQSYSYQTPQPQPSYSGLLKENPNKQYGKLKKYSHRDCFICFSEKKHKQTYFLSNYFPAQVQLWGMTFPSAESAYQAAKFAQQPQLMAQFTRFNGEAAKKAAHQFKRNQRPDWYAVKEAVMLDVLRAKFQQNPELRNLLLATGDVYLVNHTKHDAYWGDAGNGKGKNRLGYLLMQVRGEMGGVGIVQEPYQYRKYLR